MNADRTPQSLRVNGHGERGAPDPEFNARLAGATVTLNPARPVTVGVYVAALLPTFVTRRRTVCCR